MTISGGNFVNGANIPVVNFGNVQAAVISYSSTQILAVVPANGVTGPINVYTGIGGGSFTTGASFTVAPRISDFSPAAGAVGAAITINGANFINGAGNTVIQFGGVAVVSSNVLITSTSQLVAKVPAGAVTGPITVITFAGTNNSATNFIVAGTGPVITDFSPAMGATNTGVVISGGDFTTTTNVTFNGVSANFGVTAATQISATVPAGATTGKITVKTTGGTATSASNFVVTGKAPLITGFTPTAGKPGDPIVIDGLNFTTATSVTFNGTNAAFGVTSDTQITATVPAGVSTGPIRVQNPAGTGVSSSNFLVGPRLTGFSPASGPVGTAVNLAGDNFIGVTDVKFGGTNANFSVVAQGQITATVPPGAPTGPVTVISSIGTNTSSSNFVVTASAPIVTGFNPTNGFVGSSVVIAGTGFTGATNVTFNGTNANFSITSDTQISATVPPGATTGPLKVSTPGGSGTSAGLFYLPPQLGTFTPASGVVGSTVTLPGSNFTGATEVRFPGTNATPASASFTVVSAGRIDALVPTNATSGPLTVVTPGGLITSGGSFTVLPRVTGFSPSLGPVGTSVAITGTSFYSVNGVTFNGVSATFTNVSATLVTTAVPFGAGTGPVAVSTPDGSGSSGTNFTVTTASDLVVTVTTAPDIVVLGQNLTYTVTVSNRGPSIATAVTLTDTLQNGATFVSATPSQGISTQTNGVVTSRLGVITNGLTATVIIVVTPFTGGVINHSASVTSAEGDLNPGDNFVSQQSSVITDAQRTLFIRRLAGGTQVEVSWPVSSVNFLLQSATNLAPAINWVTLTNGLTVATNQSPFLNVLTNAPTTNSAAQFFRLKSP